MMLGFIYQSNEDIAKYFEKQIKEAARFLRLDRFLKRFIWVVFAIGVLSGILIWIFYGWGWGLFTIVSSVMFTYQFFFIFWLKKIEKKQRELFFKQK